MKSLIIIPLLAMVLLTAWPVSGPAPVQADNLTHTCGTCHRPHTAQGVALIRGNGVNGLCLSCHGPGGSAVIQAQAHALAMSQNPGVPKICTECHQIHGRGMISAPLTTPLSLPGMLPPNLYFR